MMTMDGAKVEPSSGVVGVVGGGGGGGGGLIGNSNSIIGTATNTGNNNQVPQTNNQLCAGCGKHIQDRFLLRALDMLWHEDCLKCGCCDCRLGEVGSTLYTKGNLMLCKRDYLRLFGSTGFCAACNKVIPAFEMVMRARSNVYHLECFACQQCNHRFCVGDRFYLCENKILCEYDYEERMVFASMANHPMLKRQANNLGGSGSPLHGGNQNPSPGTQHNILSGHHQAVVNGHHRGGPAPQGDMNNNTSLSSNHNNPGSPFGGISSKAGGCNQNQLTATS